MVMDDPKTTASTTGSEVFPEIMTSAQAMAFLQIGRTAFNKAVKAGAIPCWRISRKLIRFSREALKTVATCGTGAAAAAHAPPTPSNFEVRQTPATPAAMSDDFLQWWERYPKKIGKRAASSAWRRIKGKPPIEVMLDTLAEQIESEQWTQDAGQYIPNPATYLSQGRWDDELQQVDNSPWMPEYAREDAGRVPGTTMNGEQRAEAKRAYLADVEGGAPLKVAARDAGVTMGAVRNWRDSDKAFDEAEQAIRN